MILSALRKLVKLDREVREGVWDPVGQAKPMPPFREMVLGCIGLGRIGQAVLRRMRPFGFQLVGFDPLVTSEAAAGLGAQLLDLDSVLSQADVVTLHLPLTPETKHLLNEERLAKMKPGAVIVNAARGGLIDTRALLRALETGHISAAALDVFEDEPLPGDSRLREMENVILSPHVAWYSDRALERLQRLVAEEALRALRGEPLRCPV